MVRRHLHALKEASAGIAEAAAAQELLDDLRDVGRAESLAPGE